MCGNTKFIKEDNKMKKFGFKIKVAKMVTNTTVNNSGKCGGGACSGGGSCGTK